MWPVFLPAAGCPGRCLYCDQPAQTGSPASPPEAVLARLSDDLEKAWSEGRGPFELGFFGGSFTALPALLPFRFLDLAGRYARKGLIAATRCSTRPDAADPALLAELAGRGLSMVEFGLQSLDPDVLRRSGRGHGPECAALAVAAARRAGLGVGAQLMAGLPGQTPEVFAGDVAALAGLKPDMVRLYPCLVLSGTPLARLYAAGAFAPWDIETTLTALSGAVRVLWAAGVRVGRIGLTPEPTFLSRVLAGPWRPALGSGVRALALFGHIRDLAAARGIAPEGLRLPSRLRGGLFGQAGERLADYAGLGLTPERISFEDRDDILLVGRGDESGPRDPEI